MDKIQDFVKHLEPTETPLVTPLRKGAGWTVPDFCAKTKKQTVEPFFTYYEELSDTLNAIRPETDYYEEDWGAWEPSPSYIKLSQLANRIGQLAYQEIDNPVYDADACRTWKEENAKNWGKIVWGPSERRLDF